MMPDWREAPNTHAGTEAQKSPYISKGMQEDTQTNKSSKAHTTYE